MSFLCYLQGIFLWGEPELLFKVKTSQTIFHQTLFVLSIHLAPFQHGPFALGLFNLPKLIKVIHLTLSVFYSHTGAAKCQHHMYRVIFSLVPP